MTNRRHRFICGPLAAFAAPRALAALMALMALMAVMPVAACAQGAALVPAQSEIVFTTRQMGVPVEGRFGRFTAQIALDPKQPEAGSVTLSIDTASARFGAPELDGEVGKPTWLAAAKFPQAQFQSSAIKSAGAGRFEVLGKLTLKGAVRELVVPVQLTQAGSQGVASGSFTVKRLDFKVGEGEWADTALLANDVQVRFKLTLTGLAPP